MTHLASILVRRTPDRRRTRAIYIRSIRHLNIYMIGTAPQDPGNQIMCRSFIANTRALCYRVCYSIFGFVLQFHISLQHDHEVVLHLQ